MTRSRRQRRWQGTGWVIAALVVGTALQIGWRLVLVRGRTGPLALPDEGGYLLDARVLAGGLPADMSGWPLYRGGYPVLIAPVYWLVQDPVSVYRAVLVENAVLNALVFPLTYLLAHRVFAVSRRPALLVAFGAALLPGVVFYSEWALSDAVLVVVVTAWLLAIGHWLGDVGGRNRLWAGFAASVLSAYADAVHSRGVVLAAVFGGVLLVAYRRRWDERRRVVAVGAVLVGGLVVAAWFNGWVAAQDWPRGSLSLLQPMAGHLTSWHGLGRTALVTIGALWAMAVSTLGLGAAAIASAPRWLRHAEPARGRVVVATVTVVATLAIATAAAAAGVEEHRVGNWAYSRYLACLDPALVVCGIAALTGFGRRSGVRIAAVGAGLLGASALILGIAARHQIHAYSFVQFDFPEASPLMRSWTALHVPTATVVVLALFGCAAAALVAWPRARLPAVAALLAAVGAYSGIADVNRISAPWEAWAFPHGRTYLEAAGVRPPSPVAVQACCWGTVPELRWEDYWGVPAFVNVDPKHPPAGFNVVVVATTPPTGVHWRGWRRTLSTAEWTVWTRARRSS